jgi:hypothetical protein
MNFIRKRRKDRKRCQELKDKIDFIKSLRGHIDGSSPYYSDKHSLPDYERELESLLSKSLLEKANRLGVELPDPESFWYMKTEHGGYRTKVTLNEEGRNKVRKLIKAEQRKNVEWWVVS